MVVAANSAVRTESVAKRISSESNESCEECARSVLLGCWRAVFTELDIVKEGGSLGSTWGCPVARKEQASAAYRHP